MNIVWIDHGGGYSDLVMMAAQALGATVVPEADNAMTLVDAVNGSPKWSPPSGNGPIFWMIDGGDVESTVQLLHLHGCGVVRVSSLRSDMSHAVRLTAACADFPPRRMRLPPLLVRSELCHQLPNDPELAIAWSAEIWREAIERLAWTPAHAYRLASAAAAVVENAMLRGNLEISPALADAGDAAMVSQLVAARQRQSPYRERAVWASCRFSSQGVCIVVRDEGPGFTSAPDWPAGVSAPALGRGGLILRALCRDVRYNAEGNEVTFVIPSTEATTADQQSATVEGAILST